MARQTPTAPILTVHRAGAEPMGQPSTVEEVEQAQHEAHDALMRMSLVLSDTDHLRKSAVLLARSIRMRQSQARLQQRRPWAEQE
jgi:hypothetical protein